MLLGLNLDCPGHGTQGIFGTVGLVVTTRALFTSSQKPKIFQDSPSHRIFRHMHGVLNIDKNKE